MRAAGEGKDAHTCRARGRDAGRTILDDEAFARMRPHAGGGVQEKVGRRLSLGDHDGAEQMRFE